MECVPAKIENQGVRLARTPPLDAKHLWFMNLEDCGFGRFHIVILTESVV
jgi:hypothetical protein